jgi:hypothetical protein
LREGKNIYSHLIINGLCEQKSFLIQLGIGIIIYQYFFKLEDDFPATTSASATTAESSSNNIPVVE